MTFYRYFTELGADFSDLFVIQGFAQTNPDYVTFISSDALTGNIATDVAVFGLQALTGANPTDLGTVAETGDWQLAFNSGADQYYVRADVPEPASLALVALALVGAASVKRRRS